MLHQKQKSGPRKLGVVAMDVDGTLLRGAEFKYSWQAIWRHLRYDDNIRRGLLQEYENEELGYEEWCRKCVRYFQARDFTFADAEKIAETLTLVDNLERGVDLLRSEGLRVGVISGGVDTFLELKWPKYRDKLDFWYINYLVFDPGSKFLRDVTPTPYDYAHKLDALRRECKTRGVGMHESVFVGEGRNDKAVMLAVKELGGLTIASPPNEPTVELEAEVTIWSHDFLDVVDAIASRMK
jgi:phosphoserine phosphatase